MKILTKAQFKSNKKERISWYFYDFANSVFSTSVITVFLGPYLTSIAQNAADTDGDIDLLVCKIVAGAFYPLIVAISVVFQVIFLPLCASIADNTNYKKHLLFISAYIGAFATIGLFFVEDTNYMLGAILFIIANINFGISCTLYNSYLNHIATKKTADQISSIGWAFGYIGGGVLLVLNLILFNNASTIGIDDSMAIRICLTSAGVWWGIFSLIPLKYLSNIVSNQRSIGSNLKKIWKVKQSNNTEAQPSQLPTVSYRLTTNLLTTIKDARNYPQTLLFLLAYMIYNDGVQSVIALASQFGSAELGLTMDVLITAILLVQFVAFFGSLLCTFVSKRLGNFLSLQIMLFIWIVAILFAYFFLQTETEFYIMCGIVGIVLGGTQALSRSIYSQLIPIGNEAAYFSIYEISEKGTSWLGPLIFALIYNFTDSYRFAILSLAIFFVTGFILLLRFRMRFGIAK